MELIQAMCPVCGHRFKTPQQLEGHDIPCPKCGKIIPVERDWRSELVSLSTPPSPEKPQAPILKTKWEISGLFKKSILLILLGLALFMLLKGGGVAKVSFDNGLNIPVQVFIDGKFRRSLSPDEVWNHQLKTGYHGVEIRRDDGSVVERRTVYCDKGYYIYNIAGAHRYELQYHTYVASEQGKNPLMVPAPEALKKAIFLQSDADIHLGEKPPTEIEMPEEFDQFTLSAVTVAQAAKED